VPTEGGNRNCQPPGLVLSLCSTVPGGTGRKSPSWDTLVAGLVAMAFASALGYVRSLCMWYNICSVGRTQNPLSLAKPGSLP